MDKQANNRILLSMNLDNSLKNLNNLLDTAIRIKPIAILIQDPPSYSHTTEALNNKPIHYTIAEPAEPNNKNDTLTLIDTNQIASYTHVTTIRSTDMKASSSITQILISNINDNQQKINLNNIYLRPRLGQNELIKTLEEISITQRRIGNARMIIMGDVNAVSPEWCPIDKILDDCTNGESNRYHNIMINRGRLLENFLNQNKIKCINDIHKGPTFTQTIFGKTRESYIDIAAVGNKTIRTWQNFKVLKTNWKSNHKIIQLSQLKPTKKPNEHLIKWDSSNTPQQNPTKYRISTNRIHDLYLECEDNTKHILRNWFGKSQDKQVSDLNYLYDEIIKCLLLIQIEVNNTKNSTKPHHKQHTKPTNRAKTHQKLLNNISKLKKRDDHFKKENDQKTKTKDRQSSQQGMRDQQTTMEQHEHHF